MSQYVIVECPSISHISYIPYISRPYDEPMKLGDGELNLSALVPQVRGRRTKRISY